MNPTHHLQEDLLLGHGCPHEHPGVALLVDTHAALCRECSETMADIDSIAAAVMFGAGSSMPVSADLKQKTLAAASAAPAVAPTAVARPGRPRLSPAAVLALRDAGAKAPWRWLAPGVHEIRLGLEWNDVPAKLVRLRAGTRIPRHTHAGRELTLVLSGGLGDSIGFYEAGDVADYDPSISHEQHVPADEDCICLVVNERRLVAQTPVGRFFAWVTGV